MLLLLERPSDGPLPDTRLVAVTPETVLEIQHDAARTAYVRHATTALDTRVRLLGRHGWTEADRVDGEAGALLARLLVQLDTARALWERLYADGPVRVRTALSVWYPPQAAHREAAQDQPYPPARALPAILRSPALAALHRVCQGIDVGMEASHGDASATVRRGLNLRHETAHPAVPPNETIVVDDTASHARTESRFSGVTWEAATGRFRAYAFDTVVETFETEADFLEAWPRLLDEAVGDAVGTVEQMEGL